MTTQLRDLIAMNALNGLLSNEYLAKALQGDADKSARYFERMVGEKLPENLKAQAGWLQEWHANCAYQFADAMLKARDIKQA
jgi:hypothetical protein